VVVQFDAGSINANQLRHASDTGKSEQGMQMSLVPNE
jgi:hypothetical protein